MDDIIDLELEKIDAILKKIETDPEDMIIKGVEHNLWLEIRKKAKEGRRTGIGITAEGDMLAALGLRYGSDEGVNSLLTSTKHWPLKPIADLFWLQKTAVLSPYMIRTEKRTTPLYYA